MVKVYRKSQPGVSRFDNSANVSVVSSRNEKKSDNFSWFILLPIRQNAIFSFHLLFRSSAKIVAENF